jgi:hypothetical protein
MNTPRRKPVPSALEAASLAAKRFAKVAARIASVRRVALARSSSVKTRSMKRSPWLAMTFSMRRMSQRSEPMPRINRGPARRF